MTVEIIICCVFMHTPIFDYVPGNYFSWSLYALIVLFINICVVAIINIICNYDQFRETFGFVKEKIAARKNS